MAELPQPVNIDGKDARPNRSDRWYLDIGEEWLARAARLPGKSLHLAIALHLSQAPRTAAKWCSATWRPGDLASTAMQRIER
jgi:hypothetical protein